jgi:threonyl-tRNA synthetase
MIHRALLGSLERFFGCLIEHYAGAFPLWLAPVQAICLPITDSQNAYAFELAEKMKGRGLRVEVDSRNEKVGFKIREAQIQKIPYMLVVGDREEKAGTVSVRERGGENLGPIEREEFIEKILEKVQSRQDG